MKTPDPIEKWKWNEHMARPIEEALSELEREAQIRKRCFDRWILEGRLSYTDARDRQERLLSAIGLLRALENTHDSRPDETEVQAMIQELEAKGWRVTPPIIPTQATVTAGFSAAHAAVDAPHYDDQPF